MSSLPIILAALTCSACAVAGQPDVGSDAGHAKDTTPDAHVANSPMDAALLGPDAEVQGADASPSSACALTFSGVIATWTFSGEPGSQTTTPLATTASGVTGAGITRSTALIAASGTGTMNASNWGTSAQADTAKYYTMSITPPSNCTIDLTSIATDLKASTTGPAKAAVGSSQDNFGQTVVLSTSTTSTGSLAISASGPIELRLFGYNASGSIGTLRLQNTLTISGAIH